MKLRKNALGSFPFSLKASEINIELLQAEVAEVCRKKEYTSVIHHV